INPFKPSRKEKHVPNKVRASIRIKPITVSQPLVITKKVVNSDSNGLSSIGVDNTKTRRLRPRRNTKNDRVPSASKSSRSKNKEVENVKSKVVCAMCKQCLTYVNHDECLLNYVNGMTSRGCSKHMIGNLQLFINFVWKFLGTVRFRNDHVAVILGLGDLQWGNILITRVYFVEGLGHNLFLVGQFCDLDLEVAFRRNACFVRNLEGVDLLKGNRSTNLYTINLHEMVSASPICLMTRASSTKSWLWHQRLSHLNFDTINDLAKNDLVSGLPKFKYHKEHLCSYCPMRIASINEKRALCYPKNDREDIGKLGAKGDIGFFIGYSADSCAFRVNDHVAVILGLGDLQWGNILITRVYFVEGLGHNLFSVGQFCDLDLEVAFRRNACFVRNLKGVNLLKGNRSTNLYTINLHEMASASLICLMTRASSTKSWLWHQRLSHLNFDTINDLAKNDLVSGLPKFKYHKEHLCSSCPMRIASINEKRALCYPKNDREDIGKLGAKGELDLLFEAMYDDYTGGQTSTASQTVLAAHAHQVRQAPTTSTSIADSALTPTNSSSQATNLLNTSQDVEELNSQQQHVQQQKNQAPI
nr:integrase, catalytic region, zinc finger, CCHC-type, peptidase aspartic, catalytic [Tanacetum cinerariifolium]